jgi:hypothetical protein
MLHSQFNMIMFQSNGDKEQGNVFYDNIELVDRQQCPRYCANSKFVSAFSNSFALNKYTFYPVGGSNDVFPANETM